MGWAEGVRSARILAIFREPRDKFVSGLYFFARREAKRRLESAHPANISLPELDGLAHASLQVRMKAPAQEFAVIMARRERDFPWGVVADAATVEAAKRNLERDVDVVGTAARVEAFLALSALTLRWDIDAVPCVGTVNARRGTKAATTTTTSTTSTMGTNSRSGKIGRTYGFRDFTAEQQAYIAGLMAAETQVYDHAVLVASRQAAALGEAAHAAALSDLHRRCAVTDDGGGEGGEKKEAPLRISSMKKATTKRRRPQTGQQQGEEEPDGIIANAGDGGSSGAAVFSKGAAVVVGACSCAAALPPFSSPSSRSGGSGCHHYPTNSQQALRHI